MGSIVFMRHGQAENNTKRVLAGRTSGIRLTELGIEQANGTAEIASRMDFDAIYASPIERAQKTAEIVGGRTGHTPIVDERLTELDMGQFTGMPYDEIMSRHGNVFLKFYKGDAEIADSGIETFESVRGRIRQIISDVAKKHGDKNVLLVTHMDPIKAALADAMGLSAELLTKMIIANASMTVFGRGTDSLYVRAVNVLDSSRYAQDW